jgi:hypothetical protein
MLVSLLRPFGEASLLLDADAYASLPLAVPVRFNLLNHLNILISDSHDLVELENHVCMILDVNFTDRLVFWPSFRPSKPFSAKKLKILENVKDEIKKFSCIVVGHVDLSYLFAWRRNCENQLRCLPRTVRCMLASAARSE